MTPGDSPTPSPPSPSPAPHVLRGLHGEQLVFATAVARTPGVSMNLFTMPIGSKQKLRNPENIGSEEANQSIYIYTRICIYVCIKYLHVYNDILFIYIYI